MIISASYKTDIPAFYGDWFIRRLRQGLVGMINPFNQQPYLVSLKPEDVDGFVFWTKNIRPFLKYLDEIALFGRPSMVQFTINGYPKELEAAVVEWHKSVEAARIAQSKLGNDSVVWRYDTVILSDLTPRQWHVENFQRIADAISGITNEVVISFLQVYRKTKLNMDAAERDHGNKWWLPELSEMRELAAELAELATARGINMTICSQPDLITTQGPSRCIDSARLSQIAGRMIVSKTKGNRPGCECAESKDIGDYDTCPHGCIYCYAVRSQNVAIDRFKKHDPDCEFLFSTPNSGKLPIIVEKKPEIQRRLDV